MKNPIFDTLAQLKTEVTPDTGWKLRIYEQLMNSYKVSKSIKTNFQEKGKYIRYLPVAVFVLMIFLIIPTTVMAQQSNPGTILYPIKRSIESMRFYFAKDEQSKNALINEFTEERVKEFSDSLKKQDPQAQTLAAIETIKALESIDTDNLGNQSQQTISNIEKQMQILERSYSQTEKVKLIIAVKLKIPQAASTINQIIDETQIPTPIPTKAYELNVINTIVTPTAVIDRPVSNNSENNVDSNEIVKPTPTPSITPTPTPKIVIKITTVPSKMKLETESINSLDIKTLQ